MWLWQVLLCAVSLPLLRAVSFVEDEAMVTVTSSTSSSVSNSASNRASASDHAYSVNVHRDMADYFSRSLSEHEYMELMQSPDMDVFRDVVHCPSSSSSSSYALTHVYFAISRLLKYSPFKYRFVAYAADRAAALAQTDRDAFDTFIALTRLNDTMDSSTGFVKDALAHLIGQGNIAGFAALKRALLSGQHGHVITRGPHDWADAVLAVERYLAENPDDFWIFFDGGAGDTLALELILSSNLSLEFVGHLFIEPTADNDNDNDNDNDDPMLNLNLNHIQNSTYYTVLRLMTANDAVLPDRVTEALNLCQQTLGLTNDHRLVRTWQLLVDCRFSRDGGPAVPPVLDEAVYFLPLLDRLLPATLIKAGRHDEALRHLPRHCAAPLLETMFADPGFCEVLARRSPHVLVAWLVEEALFMPADVTAVGRCVGAALRTLRFFEYEHRFPAIRMGLLGFLILAVETGTAGADDEISSVLSRLSPAQLTTGFRALLRSSPRRDTSISSSSDSSGSGSGCRINCSNNNDNSCCFIRLLCLFLQICHEKCLWADSALFPAAPPAETCCVSSAWLTLLLEFRMTALIADLHRGPFNTAVDFTPALTDIISSQKHRKLLTADLVVAAAFHNELWDMATLLDPLPQQPLLHSETASLLKSPSLITFIAEHIGVDPAALFRDLVSGLVRLLSQQSRSGSRVDEGLLVALLGLRRFLPPVYRRLLRDELAAVAVAVSVDGFGMHIYRRLLDQESF